MDLCVRYPLVIRTDDCYSSRDYKTGARLPRQNLSTGAATDPHLANFTLHREQGPNAYRPVLGIPDHRIGGTVVEQ